MPKTVFQMLAAVLFVFSLAACTKDDDNNFSVSQNLPSGSWKITYFWDDQDETSYFSGYTFDFQSNGTASATNGTKTVSGTWSDGNDDSKSKLVLAFQNTDHFDELNEDWEILSQSSSKIELRHVSGGNGGTDLLTFEKN